MITEWGHMALITFMMLSLLALLLGWNQSRLGLKDAMRLQRSLVWGMFALISFSMLSLFYAFYSNDFSVAYVAAHSNSHMPILYRLAALWGGHEGSLLLWLFMLSGWMILMTLGQKDMPNDLWLKAMAILGGVAAGLAFFVLMTSNPFVRLLPWPPMEGRSLMPLLQDPGLISHPPILYAGYVGCSVSFAITVASLWVGRLDQKWAQWMRPWVLLAWSFLTLGIVLGSWWAYRELGWGGYWYWDPVENASFMPWLSATALIHALILTSRLGIFKVWTACLGILTFSLSLLGTFLVRSGILVSVHAFAVDPLRGVWLLVYLSCVIGGALLLFSLRSHLLYERRNPLHWASRPSWMMLANILLLIALVIVLFGTLYPLVSEWVFSEKLTVGPPYFVDTLTPLVVLLAINMGLAMQSSYHGAIKKQVRGDDQGKIASPFHPQAFILWCHQRGISEKTLQLLGYGVLSFLGSVLVMRFQGMASFVLLLGWALVFWMLITTCASKVSWYTKLAHGGVALCLAGMIQTSIMSLESSWVMSQGQSRDMGDVTLTLQSVDPLHGPNYISQQARIEIRDGRHTHVLYPEQRYFTDAKTQLAKVAIWAQWWRDIYIVLGQKESSNAWGVRVYQRPGVRWIWYGGLLMCFAGLSAFRRRR